MQKIFLKGRECCLALPRDKRKYPLLTVICGANEELLQELAKRFPHMLLFAPSIQWERDFTPWPAPGLSAETPFLGEASAYLSFLEQEALPFLKKTIWCRVQRKQRPWSAIRWAGSLPHGRFTRAPPLDAAHLFQVRFGMMDFWILLLRIGQWQKAHTFPWVKGKSGREIGVCAL